MEPFSSDDAKQRALETALQQGLEDDEAGRVVDAETVFAALRENLARRSQG